MKNLQHSRLSTAKATARANAKSWDGASQVAKCTHWEGGGQQGGGGGRHIHQELGQRGRAEGLGQRGQGRGVRAEGAGQRG